MTNSGITNLNFNSFLSNGFSIVKLKNSKCLNRMRLRLEDAISEFLDTNLKATFSYLEENKLKDSQLQKLLVKLNETNIDFNDFKTVCDELQPLFKPVLGDNIACAKNPFIRFVQQQDTRVAFDMHSDTFYGDSFFDIAIWIQLSLNINTPSLRVIPGSHMPPSGKYNIKAGENKWDPKFIKGKNIGLAYQPKVVSFNHDSVVELFIPYGSVLVFFGSLLHATYPHNVKIPRLSADCRLTPLLLPQQFRGNKPGYFKPIYVTDITKRILDCYSVSPDEFL